MKLTIRNNIIDQVMDYKEKGEEIKELIKRECGEKSGNYKSIEHIVNDIAMLCDELDHQRYHDFRGRVDWKSLVNDSDLVS